MRLQYKVNLVCLGVLALVACAIAAAGVWTIDRLTYDLNEKILSSEVSNVSEKISETWQVLEVSGVAGVAGYVESARKELFDELAASAPRRIGHLAIVDASGNVVMHDGAISGAAFAPDCLADMFVKGEGVVECPYQGENRFFFYHSFPTWNWLVILSVSTDEMFAMRNEFLRYVAAILLVSLVFGGLIFIWLTRGIVEPVRRLAQAAMRLSRGEWDTDIPEVRTGDEVGDLARSFSVMSKELSGAQRRLESQAGELLEVNRSLNQEVSVRTRAEEELAELNRSLEEAVAERTEDLERKAEELEKANVRLLEMDAMKSAFLSSVSHELRTPLTSILGFAKLIAKDFLRYYRPLSTGEKRLERSGERIRQNLGIVEHEGMRLTRMINDFLDLAKIESGRVDWHDREMHPEELINRAVAAVQGDYAQKTRVALRVELAPNLPCIQVDPDRIEQVLINLLNNAAKFTEAGSVTVSAKLDGAGALDLRVKDTGTGIPRRDQEMIFDKFQQAMQEDTLKEKPRGTGLGLTISRQIVEHYGGSIRVESKVGEGSEFIVIIPGMAEREQAEAGAECIRPLILVVDDDPGVSSYLGQFFRAEGYGAVSAKNGLEALDMAVRLKPDLITMDIIMPDMDGRATIQTLRANPDLARIPILVVSILHETEVGMGDAALRKPVDEVRLLAAVHDLLGCDKAVKPGMDILGESVTKGGNEFAICQGGVIPCGEEDLKRHIAAGFSGTVIIPGSRARSMDLSFLSSLKGVQALILPEADSLAGKPGAAA
jgi:signal transduction histidine kinase